MAARGRSGDGTAEATCGPHGARLLYESPAQGLEVFHIAPGPGTVASVTFANSSVGVSIKVTCDSSGVPVGQDTKFQRGARGTRSGLTACADRRRVSPGADPVASWAATKPDHALTRHQERLKAAFWVAWRRQSDGRLPPRRGESACVFVVNKSASKLEGPHSGTSQVTDGAFPHACPTYRARRRDGDARRSSQRRDRRARRPRQDDAGRRHA